MIITVGLEKNDVSATIQLTWKEVQALKSLVELGMSHIKPVTQDEKMAGAQFVKSINRIKITWK
jgi:hypothetical protein